MLIGVDVVCTPETQETVANLCPEMVLEERCTTGSANIFEDRATAGEAAGQALLGKLSNVGIGVRSVRHYKKTEHG